MVLNRYSLNLRILIIVLTLWLTGGCQGGIPFHSTPTPLPTYTPNPTYTPESTLTPAPTYTPEPSVTPYSIPGEPMQVLLEEDFTQGALCFPSVVKGFYLGDKSSQSVIENGAFHMVIDAKAGEMYTSPCLLIELNTFTVEVDIQMLTGSEKSAAGMAIVPVESLNDEYNLGGNYLYTFTVNRKGEYCFYKHDNSWSGGTRLAGCWAPLVNIIQTKTGFTMKIQRDKDGITLFLKDQLVASPLFEELKGDNFYIGLATGWADQAGKIEILFDNVLIATP